MQLAAAKRPFDRCKPYLVGSWPLHRNDPGKIAGLKPGFAATAILPVHQAVSPLAVFNVVWSLRQMPLAVRVDMRHVLKVLVCEVRVLLWQQFADVPAGLVALGLPTFRIPTNLLGLVRLEPVLKLLLVHIYMLSEV